MVFGREFKNLSEEDKRLLLSMAERLNAGKDGAG